MKKVFTFAALLAAGATLLTCSNVSQASVTSVVDPNNVLSAGNNSFVSNLVVGSAPDTINGTVPNADQLDEVIVDPPSGSLAITGFTADLSSIRLWSYDRDSINDGNHPKAYDVYVSTSLYTTSVDALNIANYTLVANVPAQDWFNPEGLDGLGGGGAGNSGNNGYFDTTFTTVVGAQSLLIVFDQRSRVTEVQAFEVIPEPASAALMGLGLMVIAGRRRQA